MKFLKKETFEAIYFDGDNVQEVLDFVGDDNFKYGADMKSIFIDEYYTLNVTSEPKKTKLIPGSYILYIGTSSVSNRRFQVFTEKAFEEKYFKASEELIESLRPCGCKVK